MSSLEPGGIGGNFGGYLARAGVDVTFIARGEHLRAIRENGLQIETPKGNFLIKLVQVTENLSEVGKADAIFVCTKAWQLEKAANAIKPLMGANTFVSSTAELY